MGDSGGESAVAERKAGALRGARAPDLLRDELLSEIFASTAAAQPEAPCVKTPEGSLTYGEVDARSTAIARGLLALGGGPGEPIGLWAPRGAELVIAILAIAKTGAAWLPFDAEAPVERIASCVADAGARLLLAAPEFAAKARKLPCKVLLAADITPPGDAPMPGARALGARPETPAFIIYTSGSTGTPKGVAITNRNICHYLRAANEIYGVTQSDVVYQGASAAFDMSVEEIWLAFLSGAALFVATPEIVAETETLPDVLEKAGVTVFDTVPTLLGVLPRDPATLRIIILGGEACPPAIADRWSREGRPIFNTYGPTETTVVATIAEVRRGDPVTIGQPIPNYTCYVVDEALRLLPPGVEGELLIGGPGVAPGYLNRPELTGEKFIANPFAADGGDPVLYRTGDAVLVNNAGQLVFRGRMDDQVKIRGFRVEPGEIEAALECAPMIRQAAVVLRKDGGDDELVAFLLADEDALDLHELRAKLRQTLPPYMVPARFEVVDRLPRLASKKIDRKALALAPLTRKTASEEQEPPRNETEALLLAAARRTLPPGAIPFDADFFTDLGGHSLLAARFVSALRETPRLASVALHDLYELRTLRALAKRLDGKSETAPQTPDLAFEPPPLLRRFLCGLAQATALPLILAFSAAPWIAGFAAYGLTQDETPAVQIAAVLASGAGANLVTLFVSIIGKWLAIGRAKPGRYPLWGTYYFHWWLAQRLIGLTPTFWLQNTPLMPIYLRALGARVAEDAMIGELHIGAVDLVTIGPGAALGSRLILANARVERNELVIGSAEIGAEAQIGTACVIEEDTVVGAGAALEDLTALTSGARIGAGGRWEGAAARYAGTVDANEDKPAVASMQRRRVIVAAHLCLALLIPPARFVPLLPALWLFSSLSQTLPAFFAIWPASIVAVLTSVACLAAFRWLVLPRVSPGKFSLWSSFSLRLRATALAAESVMPTLSSLHSTVFAASWNRLMGARIGRGAELSTNLAGRYDLVELGEDCFIADDAALGEPRFHRGWMTLESVTLGARAFVGNDAVVPQGARLPADTLIGARSRAPTELLQGESWFGSPPICLPARETHDGAEALTYRPPAHRVALRIAYETLSVSLPSVVLLSFGASAAADFSQRLSPSAFVQHALLLSLGAGLAAVAAKWLTMGRHAPQARPMWSFWTMRTESSVVLYRGLARRFLFDHLRGTPFLPWMLRLLGANIGRGVFMDTTLVTEFDCVKIGDHCALNTLAALQTHLYEDRVMKVGRVTLGLGVAIGAGGSALYNAHIGDYARLGPLTTAMKGESIPACSAWLGTPAERAPAPRKNGPP